MEILKLKPISVLTGFMDIVNNLIMFNLMMVAKYS